MNVVKVDDPDPWCASRHLQVWCGEAYLLVRKQDGLTSIGYRDEELSTTLATDAGIADWLTIFQRRAAQTSPWTSDPTAA
jgi:hypothetical protein